jgi:hypothetical protein
MSPCPPLPASRPAHRLRGLKPGAFMIHCIDYRDHFFKYPYHFLLFSKKTWDTFLNPGDLFRYRVSDHVNIMENAGFKVNALTGSKDSLEFEKIRTMVHPDFNKYSQEELMTTYSELFTVKAGA